MTRGTGETFLTVGATLLASLSFVYALRESVFDTLRITNESMLPYLSPGKTVVILKTDPCFKIPFTHIQFSCDACRAGHAYVFKSPQNPGQRLVKFATAQATRSSSRGIKTAPETSSPKSCYFEGSNKEKSVDSRHFGSVPLDLIEGRVVYPRVQAGAI